MDKPRDLKHREESALAVLDDGQWHWFDVDRDAQWWSPRFYEILGFQKGEIEPSFSSWLERAIPADRDRILEELRASLADGEPVDLRCRIRRNSGELVEVRIRAKTLRDSTGRPRRMIGSLREVTHRRPVDADEARIQRELQRLQLLDGVALTAGELAHDFNNLLLAVVANAELLAQRAPNDPTASRAATQIFNAVDQAKELSVAMASLAKEPKVARPCDLSETLRSVRSVIRATVRKKVDLRFELAQGLPLIAVSSQELIQIALNLVLNAAEACGAREGCIRLRTGLRQLDADRILVAGPSIDEPLVVLEVSDNGTGISELVQSRMFDPFYTTKFSGSGLGLSSVLSIAAAHGGTISVESGKGRGTTIEIAFPPLQVEPRSIMEFEKVRNAATSRGHLAWMAGGDRLTGDARRG